MTVIGEFELPADAFPLSETLAAVPDAAVSLVRVTISPELLSPYLWVSASEFDTFNDAAAVDPSVAGLEVLDEFDGVVLCRVSWDLSVVDVAGAFADLDGSVLDTYTTDGGWFLRIQFADRAALRSFRGELGDADVAFRALSLTTSEAEPAVHPYGLTPKQTEALLRAWEAGYYEIPRETTLTAVAGAMGISQQALSERLQRGHAALLANTIAATLTEGGEVPDDWGTDESARL